MFIISREAPIKVGRHAWNVFPLEAFGFLLGRETNKEIYAALPCSKTQYWYKYEDRWSGVYDNFEKACSVGNLFSLDVIGFYASTDVSGRDSFPIPSFIKNTSMELMLIYQTICCPQCSWLSYKYNNKWLILGEDYVVPHGKRISNFINQKRILKEWNRVYGIIDYSNKPRHSE